MNDPAPFLFAHRGPLSRSGMIGFVGTLLHVAAWVCAIVFDMILFTQLDTKKAPGAYTYWLWGYISLLIGFVILVGVTLVHMFSSDERKIPEGGAPPFMMTLFIGGAQISLVLTLLQMVATTSGQNDDFLYIDNADGKRQDKLDAMRNLLVWTMLSKVYIVQFLKNNQEWAGPANELKKQATIIGPANIASIAA